MSRWWSSLAVVGFLALPLAACGGDNPFEASSSATVVEDESSGQELVDNPFLPEGENLSDCIGAVEKPNCGSSAKGGWRQYTVMGVLIAGLAFVGWRISKGVKARDAVVNSHLSAPRAQAEPQAEAEPAPSDRVQ